MEVSPVFCLGLVKSRQLGIRAGKILSWYLICNLKLNCYMLGISIGKEEEVLVSTGSIRNDKKKNQHPISSSCRLFLHGTLTWLRFGSEQHLFISLPSFSNIVVRNCGTWVQEL